VRREPKRGNFDLRQLLAQPGSYPRIAAAATDGERPHFAVTLFPHVGAVYRRVETAAGDDAIVDLAALRLTALVHEEPLESLPRLLATAGFDHAAPIVLAVAGAFGEVWKARSDTEVAAFVATRREHLAAILLFEVAHEGQPTDSMRRAAELGGLQAAFARWHERLACATATQPDPVAEPPTTLSPPRPPRSEVR
jgi:hypothetical protein